jgi:hypothetical protein
MEKMTFLQLAKKLMDEEKKPLSPVEMWDLAIQKGYDKQVSTLGKTPWQTISAQIYVSIRDDESSPFVKVESYPRKFYLKGMPYDEEKIIEESKEIVRQFTERNLHPFLSYYAFTSWKVYTKTIYHEQSSKSSYGQWLHPDVVGIYLPFGADWKTEVFNVSKEIGSPYVRFYSFELKKELGFSKLREYFFQAVSNSSWANYGYIVAADIDDDPSFQYELNRLSRAFGIGVIKLDIEDPNLSETIYPARYNTDLDWDKMNKLSSENPNFRDFMVRVQRDVHNSEIIKERYDKVFSIEELIEYMNKKK